MQDARPMPPHGPVLDWCSFRLVERSGLTGSVDALPFRISTTSGRAAIYHALRQLQLRPGTPVLVPSYHCPTMVAPIVLAGHQIVFYGIRSDGLPKLDTIDREVAVECKAMIVSHYFGFPRSLNEVRAWCDTHGVALIEDCAHTYFGTAGDRPVGSWGDFCTASVSKFFPVSEAGLLASSRRPLRMPPLVHQGVWAECKAIIDIFENAAMHRRFVGINSLLRLLVLLKNACRKSKISPENEPDTENRSYNLPDSLIDVLMRYSDMNRVGNTPSLASLVIKSVLPRGRILKHRQRNFALYSTLFQQLDGSAWPLFKASHSPVAPYVFPLWVVDVDRVYYALREQGLPVLRWDFVWPGVPAMEGDVGPLWSRHVLQLLCHQDLSEDDIRRTVRAVERELTAAPIPSGQAAPLEARAAEFRYHAAR